MRHRMATFLVPIALGAIGLAACPAPAAAVTIDFEDAHLGGSLAADDYRPVATPPYGPQDFTSQGLTFSSYNGFDRYYYWGDWAYSNMTDNTTRGYLNQYSAFPGQGVGGSPTYGLLYGDAYGSESGEVAIPPGLDLQEAWFTNTTYAYYEMLEGSPYSDKLEPRDWVNMTIRGYDETDALLGSLVFYLADFTSGDPNDHYIVGDWRPVNLSSLAGARRLTFAFDENPQNKDDWGQGPVMSHPSYVAMDNLVLVGPEAAVPEPSTIMLALFAALLFICRPRLRLGR